MARRCGYCFETGHNRRTCPVEKADIERYKKEGIRSWAVENYEKRMKERSTKKCSYCKTPGHTIRTCQEYKNDLLFYSGVIISLRNDIFKACTNIGLAPGALMKFAPTYDFHGKSGVYIVTDILWEDITFNSVPSYRKITSQIIKARQLNFNKYGRRKEAIFKFPNEVYVELNKLIDEDYFQSSPRINLSFLSPAIMKDKERKSLEISNKNVTNQIRDEVKKHKKSYSYHQYEFGKGKRLYIPTRKEF